LRNSLFAADVFALYFTTSTHIENHLPMSSTDCVLHFWKTSAM